MINAFTTFTLALAFALGLSLVVERILEMLKSLYDMLDSRLDLHRFWTHRAEDTKRVLQNKLRIFEYANPKAVARLLSKSNEVMLGPDHGYTGTIPIISGDLVRAVGIRIVMKTLGIAIGLTFAIVYGLDIRALVLREAATPAWIVLTGIAIGLGSSVVHKMICALEKQRETRLKKEAARA
ncbi:MAG TPA: hypothetical protein VFO52_15300 [Longimicrobiales bacterium]|nr:hypothetical protein [Longimicrobiales bacterium]